MLRLRFTKDQIITAAILTLGVFFSFLIIQANAQSSGRNASISLKKDFNNLFIITIKDPQGIKEFSLQPPGKFSYGGEISGCPASRKIDNVVFDDPTDFTPAMNAYVVDCNGNKDELEIPPPKNGTATAVRVGIEAEQPAAPAQKSTKPSTSESAPSASVESVTPPKKLGINYPVKELGSCGSEFECRVYCDNSDNIKQCLDYAEKNNLIK